MDGRSFRDEGIIIDLIHNTPCLVLVIDAELAISRTIGGIGRE
jgi:hypothetical protein